MQHHKKEILQHIFEEGRQALAINDSITAERAFLKILEHDVKNVKALHYLGYAKAINKDFSTALNFGYQALQHNYQDPQIYIDLAYWHTEKGEYQQAIDVLEPKITFQPRYVKAYKYLGLACRRLNLLLKAITYAKIGSDLCRRKIKTELEKLIRLVNKSQFKPQSRQNHTNNILKCLQEINIWKRYLNHFYFEKGYAKILNGNLEEGWKDCESRSFNPYYQDLFLQYPYWNGEDLRDKSILILSEQGIGDEIIYSNTFSEVISQAKYCLIACDPRLKELFQRSFNADIVPYRQDCNLTPPLNLKIDYVTLAASICKIFRRNLGDFSIQTKGWLQPQASIFNLSHFSKKLKIGLAWRSLKNRNHYHDAGEYLNLSDLLPLLEQDNIDWINLQYDEPEEEIDALRSKTGITLHQINGLDLFLDLDGTAGLMQELDLIVAPTTATIALAGACGFQAWCPCSDILQFTHCGQYHMPFFPSVTCFRRQAQENWQPVIQAMASQLKSLRCAS